MTTVEASAAQSVPAWRAWVMAARLRTLPVAVAPVVVGTAVAASEGVANPLPAFGALIGALLLQLASNFANDVFDMEKGADTEERIGPPRATQLGLLSPDASPRNVRSTAASDPRRLPVLATSSSSRAAAADDRLAAPRSRS